jgi:hypothetical protein
MVMSFYLPAANIFATDGTNFTDLFMLLSADFITCRFF